ncbi:MAG: hypothetical protein ACFE0S_04635 [Rhodospirillales bacterium]
MNSPPPNNVLARKARLRRLIGKFFNICITSAVLLAGACGVADHLNYAVVFEGEDYGESFHIRAEYLPITGLTKEDTIKLALLRAAYVTKDKGYKYLYLTGPTRITKYYMVYLFAPPIEAQHQELRLLFHVTNEFDPNKESFFKAQEIIDSKEIQALR